MQTKTPITTCETLNADDLDQVVAGTGRRTYEPIVVRKRISPPVIAESSDPAETMSS